MNNQITYQLVNTAGEISAIVLSPVANRYMPAIAKFLMQNNKRIEQVGYLDPVSKSFRMMGGELSVNGLLAAEFVKTGNTSVRLSKSIIRSIVNNKITYNGMSYLILPNPPQSTVITTKQKLLLQGLVSDNPASGLIYYENSSIKPLIYVRATNTYVWEQSCGSGSIACALYSGNKRIIQPSGIAVNIQITKTWITYQAQTTACLAETVLIGSKEVI